MTPGNPDELLSFNSAICKIPLELLSQFRTVSIVKPDLRLTLEVLLISQGFQKAAELAKKTMLLFDLLRQLIGTNAPITDSTEHMSKYNNIMYVK